MTVQILIGDCREVLATLPARSFQTCITSPPYFGLRDYDEERQIGSEATPDEFVAVMVDVFREVHRVLRDDGTLWLNLGDSYCTHPHGHLGANASDPKLPQARQRGAKGAANRRPLPGVKHKDLIGIPWRVALALQADGWFLRRDIIWHKLNPMPESVRDRPTTAHEYLFLLSKSGRPTVWRAVDTAEWSSAPNRAEKIPNPRRDEDGEPETISRWQSFDYYYNADAIMEPSSPDTHARAARGRSDAHKWADGGPGDQTIARKAPSAGRVPGVTPKSADEDSKIKAKGSFHASTTAVLPMRNKRSVWATTSAAFAEAHFATYPQALIEPCILAGSPGGGSVLDPFGGAGTTGLAADRLGRDCTLIELSAKYAAMAQRRLRAGLCRVAGEEAPMTPGPLFDGAAA